MLALHRVECVLKCLGNKLFIDEFFGHYDDIVLGLMLWNCGFKSIAIPEIVAEHLRGSTFSKRSPLSEYLLYRNRIVMAQITNTKFKDFVIFHSLESSIRHSMYEIKLSKVRDKAIIDGLKLGRKIKSKGFL
jgi:GT2 family glycosyltransferase